MSIARPDLDQSILKGVKYLHQHQFPNGEFCCYIGHEDQMRDTVPDANIFPASLICYSLLQLAHIPEANEILQLTASFLQSQSMRAGVWNNFTTAHKYFKICSADVDNTCCASIVLKSLQRDYTANEEILLLNRSKSGLFYTWYTFRPNTVWDKNYWLLILREFKFPVTSYFFWTKNEARKYDIDAAVNANVLFYLGLKASTEPIIKYILAIIAQNKEDNCDAWYRNPFTIYYFFSRNYKAGIEALEPIKKPVTARILKTAKNDGTLGESILDTALGAISLMNLGHHSSILDQAINQLIQTQGQYGEWPRWALYYGGPKKLQCYGSEEMTTGFCLEALAMYNQHLQKGNHEST